MGRRRGERRARRGTASTRTSGKTAGPGRTPAPARPGLDPRAAGLGLALLPAVAILILLAPYLWPLDHAPTAEFSDIHHQHAPAVELLARGWRDDGELPRWNVQDFAGLPTVGDPQAGAYNPLYWLLALRPGVRPFGLLIVAYALAGAAGLLLYARALGLSTAAAAAGATAFTLGGSLLLRLTLPGHVVFGPVYLLPLLLLALRRVAEAPRPPRIAAAAGLAALVAVGTHPQLLAYSTVVLAALTLAFVRDVERPARALAGLAAAGTLGLGLAAVHVLPIFALAGEFSRALPSLAGAARDLEAAAFDRSWLAAVVASHGPAPDADFEWEAHYYLGAPALALAALGLLAWGRGDPRRRLAALHGGLAAGLVLFGLGSTGGLGPFRTPARALILCALPASILVALGVDALARAPERRRRVGGIIAFAGAAVALAAAGATAGPLLCLLLGAGGALLLATAGAGTGAPAGAAGAPVHPAPLAGALALVAALALDAGRVVAPCVRTAPEREIGRLAPGVTLPSELPASGRLVEMERGAVDPGVPELAVRRLGLETLAGFNPLLPWRFVVYASRVSGLDPRGYSFDIAVPFIGPAAPQLLDLLGVTHVLRPPERDAPAWRWERSPTALPRAYLVPGPIVEPDRAGEDPIDAALRALERVIALDPRRHVLLHGAAAEAALAAIGAGAGQELEPFRAVPLAARTANRIAVEVSLERPGILVLNEPFFAGWRAHGGGGELAVLRANVLFRALALPPGEHRVVLEFAPVSWRTGRWVSLGALALALALAAAPSARRFRLAPRGVGPTPPARGSPASPE